MAGVDDVGKWGSQPRLIPGRASFAKALVSPTNAQGRVSASTLAAGPRNGPRAATV